MQTVAALPSASPRLRCKASAPQPADTPPAPALSRRAFLSSGSLLATPALVSSARAASSTGVGKLALVTGASSGVGYETALGLLAAGFEVVLACRTVGKGQAAGARLTERLASAKVTVLDAPLELTSLASVAAYAAAVNRLERPLDLLVNNAGVMAAPLEYTGDGHELHHQTNHLAHFALTTALLPALRAAPGARCINVSSLAAFGGGLDVSDLDWRARPYEKWSAYCASKASNVLFADALALREPSLLSVSLHPGIVATRLARYLVPDSWLEPGPETAGLASSLVHALGVRTSAEGAVPSLWAATTPAAELVNGGFYLDAEQLAPLFGRPGADVAGAAQRDALWERSLEEVGDAAAGRMRA